MVIGVMQFLLISGHIYHGGGNEEKDDDNEDGRVLFPNEIRLYSCPVILFDADRVWQEHYESWRDESLVSTVINLFVGRIFRVRGGRFRGGGGFSILWDIFGCRLNAALEVERWAP
jgi:hypothetical protein